MAKQLQELQIEATELLDDGRDLPGADALDVHLSDGERHGPFAADAAIKGLRVERPPVLVTVVAGLGDPQIYPALVSLRSTRTGTTRDLQNVCCTNHSPH